MITGGGVCLMGVKSDRDIILKVKNLLQYPKTVIEMVRELEEHLKNASDDTERLKRSKRMHGLIIEYLDDGLDAIKRIVKELNVLLRRYERQERGKK